MSDHGGDGDMQRQCRRGVAVDVVELGAALALADMAGAAVKPPPRPACAAQDDEDEEMVATTRLTLQLGNNNNSNVGIQSSSCSSSGSSAGRPALPPPPSSSTSYGPKLRHMLTEEEKEAKRLRRVLANRESARQTILRRQAIRDELARKVADLSTQNESMKKERETVMQEYLSLKETNKQLKEQAHHLSLSLF
ncbi:G-box-binding factor 1-like [Oryza brachyantha]|uniref:BZIP domain-containing protein n=1 Tax=Oryza brachyantha TaxID=4533 RepID=J3NBH8_ORYBR|nr:G-box-binding factor 1-like [Oryza brachyantha]